MYKFIHEEKTKLTNSQKVKIMLFIARGVAHLHSRNIVHRDIKSPNILIMRDLTRVVLCDLGLAKTKAIVDMMSRAGTIHWMAPEIMTEQPYTNKVDIYSMGLVFFEIATGTMFWPTMTQTWITREVPPPNNARPQFPAGVEEQFKGLIELCWHPDPAQRPTATSVVEMLQKFKEFSLSS